MRESFEKELPKYEINETPIGFGSTQPLNILYNTFSVGKFGNMLAFTFQSEGYIEVTIAASRNIRVVMDLNGDHFQEIQIIPVCHPKTFILNSPEFLILELPIHLSKLAAQFPERIGVFELIYFEILDRRSTNWNNLLLEVSHWISSLDIHFTELEALSKEFISPRHRRRKFNEIGITRRSLEFIERWYLAQRRGATWVYYDQSHYNRATKRMTQMNPFTWNQRQKNVRFVQHD